MKVLIIGSSPAGIACATRLKRNKEGAQIVIIEPGASILCADELTNIYNIDLRLQTSVVANYPGMVQLHHMLSGQTYQENFDHICIFDPTDSEITGRNRADELSQFFRPTVPFLSTKITHFTENTLIEVGLTEQALISQAKDYVYSVLPIQAGFLTLYYNAQGNIYGFSALGQGMTYYADMVYAIMSCGGGIFALVSSKNVYLQTLGKIAQNVAEGRLQIAYPDQMTSLNLSKTTILDVRSFDEANTINFPDAVHIPLQSLRTDFLQLDPAKHIVIVCKTGKLSYIATRFLSQRGYKASILTGGMDFYVHASTCPHRI